MKRCMRAVVIAIIIRRREHRGGAGVTTTWALELECGHHKDTDKWLPDGSWPAPVWAWCRQCQSHGLERPMRWRRRQLRGLGGWALRAKTPGELARREKRLVSH